jgi:hypothetical protein
VVTVVVTALNPSSFSWWQRFGFDPFDAEDSTNLDLYPSDEGHRRYASEALSQAD